MNVGARPADRDEVDRHIIRAFKQRKGRIIDSQEEVGGYPLAAMTRRQRTAPDDVNVWLAQLSAALE